MRNVVYADTDTGYACADCGEPIPPNEMWAEGNWPCGHPVHCEIQVVVIDKDDLRREMRDGC